MLKALLQKEEWDALPDDVKEHYVEKDGVMQLGVTPADGIELMNPTQLKKTLQKERAAASEAEKARKALEVKLGDLDVDEAREALVKLEEMAGMDPEGKSKAEREAFEKSLTTKFEDDRKKLIAKHQGEAEAASKAALVIEGQLQHQMIAAAGTKAITEAGGSPELLLPIFERMSKMRKKDDGTFEVVILDDENMDRLSPVANSTALMTYDELAEELKGNKKFARAYDGSGASGSGAGRSGAIGGTGTGLKLSTADSKDPAKYRAAKAAAVKAGRELVIAD